MSTTSSGLLGLACAAMLVGFSRIMFPAAFADGVADFSVGLSSA
jgi:hypothetical protein